MSRLLIVDDSPQNLYMLQVLLSTNGFQVELASNGAEALERARRAPPDMIISDILMPVMDGFALCRSWKADERLKNIPFVFYTATYTDPKDEDFGLSLGADRFITKPFEPDKLLALLRETMNNREAGEPIARRQPVEEVEYYENYNAALIRKLEDKMLQLEEANRVLESDITERKLAEAEHAKLMTAIEQSAEGVVITDTQGRIQYVNPAFSTMTGYSRTEALGANPRILKSGIHGDVFYGELWRVICAGQVWRGEVTNQRKDGSLYTEEMTITPVRDAQGAITHFIAVKQDITARKGLEEQFRQAQKMQAVGRLAGGVAHDFNNLLTIINGYSEMVLERLPTEDPFYAQIGEIRKAGERAAALTRQLLAFSRRQVLEPHVLDLNTLIADVSKMLCRLIGEDVNMITVKGHRLGRVMADPGQIEQILMNLAVNSRDAMPGGGKLTIETADVELDEEFARNHFPTKPGSYVMLAVNDTGCGMTPEVMVHIFEPFFTTKEKGKGTGLGLATVYGIVKQSGGYIWVDSEPGKGTTVKIYLPRVEQPAEVLASPEPLTSPALGTETVLLVEDESSVRLLTYRILEEQGYKILQARNGEEAILVAERYKDPIHLLATDVVMPGMSGPQLAEQLATLHRETKVLYLSGYTDDAIVYHGLLSSGPAFLQKPFTPKALAHKVREILDSEKQS